MVRKMSLCPILLVSLLAFDDSRVFLAAHLEKTHQDERQKDTI